MCYAWVKVRTIVEEQERINYNKRMKEDWKAAVGPMCAPLTLDDVFRPWLPLKSTGHSMLERPWRDGLRSVQAATAALPVQLAPCERTCVLTGWAG